MKSPFLVNWVEVNLARFNHNLRQISSGLSAKARILLVIKSDAYGHGMIRMAKEAERCACVRYLGVSTPAEALELRRSGIRKPILLLAPAHSSDWGRLIREGVSLSVSGMDEAVGIARCGRRLNRKARVHVELDTGMGRLGIRYTEGLGLLFRLASLQGVALEGAYSHFPNAGLDSDFSEDQVKVFTKIIELFSELYPRKLKWVHMANSSGLACHPGSHFNLVRPGLAVYGVRPDGGGRMALQPVLAWKTRLSLIRRVPKGSPISYGSLYRTRRATWIGTCPVGYSYGYPIRLTGRSRVLIGGRFYPVIGKITMDHIMVDLGPRTQLKRWAEVTLMGEESGRVIDVRELAQKAGTIPYEILCGIHPKVFRRYVR